MTEHYQQHLCPGNSDIKTTRVPPEAQVKVAVFPAGDWGKGLGLGQHGGYEDDPLLLSLHVVHRPYTDAPQSSGSQLQSNLLDL